MDTNRIARRMGATALLWAAGTTSLVLAETHGPHVAGGDVAFTLVGEVTNTPPDQSAQFGYLPTITGLSDLFSSATQDETTAFFTFFTQATTTAVRHVGPMTIIEREGTTTVHFNVAPHASFADPSSFQDGQTILVMDLKQQVILDTVTSSFTVVNVNEVTSASSFEKDGKRWALAREGEKFRTALAGHLNAAPPPNGHFAAYVVKIQRSES
jgi:hypothetical protein